MVADNHLAAYFHAERVQLIGDEQRVGIDALDAEQLRAGCDDSASI